MRAQRHDQASRNSKTMEHLAAEVSGMLASDGRHNRWHGYDFEYESGTVRLSAEDPEAGLEVHILDEHGVQQVEAHFGSTARMSAIAAFVRASI